MFLTGRAVEKRFPGCQLESNVRRLDRRYCIPALLKAEHGRKKDNIEWFVILNPRDVLAVYFYIDFIRPYGKTPPATDALFVNSQGDSLGYNVTR